MSAPLHVLLLSSLPESLGIAGLLHHFPVPPGPAVRGRDGVSALLVTIEKEGGEMTFRATPGTDDVPADTGGRFVVHATGTTETLAEIAGTLAGRGLPVVYSPCLPEHPVSGPFGMPPLFRREAMSELETCERIAGVARAVIAHDGKTGEYLASAGKATGGKLVTVEGPRLRPAAGSKSGEGIVALCDALSPEWNVLRLIQALEKLNCPAVIAARNDGSEYARRCTEAAGENPRVRIVDYHGEGMAEIGGELDRAAVVVDPSARGLGFPLIRGFRGGGAVISRRSYLSRVPEEGTFFFEPSSWELLHHALVGALNHSTERRAAGIAGGAPDPDAGIRAALLRLYAPGRERGG